MAGRLGLIGLVFTISTDVAEWMKGYDQIDPLTGKPKATLSDLFMKVGITVVKAVVETAITAVLTAGVVFLARTFVTAAIPFVLIVVGFLVINVRVSYAVDLLDKNIGMTQTTQKVIRKSIDCLEKINRRDYSGYSGFIESDFGWGVAP